MITFAPFPDTIPTERPRLDWLPLVLLTTGAVALTTNAPGWARMWLIAFALFAGFKWWTWRNVVARDLRARGAATIVPATDVAITNETRARRSRATAFLLLWPGMNARAFLHGTAFPAQPRTIQWTWAATKTLLGATLLYLIARLAGHGLLAGWIGMVGFIFLLHFGLFALLSLFWQSRGVDAAPLMKCPIAAISLHDFWGRRWNAGFRDIVFVLFFFPLARRYGTRAAALATFVLSGLIHELVITVPAGGGYGLPTLYFALQGLGLTFERKFRVAAPVRAWTFDQRGHGLTAANTNEKSALPVTARVSAWTGPRPIHRLTAAATMLPNRLFAIAVVTLPIAALFPPIFVTHVMVPFFQLIHAL